MELIMSEPRARKTWTLPYSWDEIAKIKQQMQIELLTRAQLGAVDAGMAARRISMTRNNYVITCRRLGVEVAHLLDRQHPRHGEAIREEAA
jgi:hypothetical protein